MARGDGFTHAKSFPWHGPRGRIFKRQQALKNCMRKARGKSHGLEKAGGRALGMAAAARTLALASALSLAAAPSAAAAAAAGVVAPYAGEPAAQSARQAAAPASGSGASAKAAAPAASNIDLNALASKAGVSVQALQYAISQARYQQKIIDAITRPSEGKPWYQYRRIFINRERIDAGVSFYLSHRESLQKAFKLYGVPPEIVCAIIGVETFYGRSMGTWAVLDALYTLGFHYPKRAAFFSQEFASFVKLCLKEGWDIGAVKGSYAGAMGMGQFMPSSYLNFAVDADGDGREDLFKSADDAIFSVANYFKMHGWQAGRGICYAVHLDGADGEALKAKGWDLTAGEFYAAGASTKVAIPSSEKMRVYTYDLEDGTQSVLAALANFKAITRYNTSPLYARAVFELSEYIRMGYVKAMARQGVYVKPEGRRP